MQSFRVHTGRVAPLERINVDTDQILPKQFLKRIERTGFGEFLFHDWRHKQNGQKDESFVLHHPHYRGASILIAGRNFGCGSSREHAVWALTDFGFRVVIAPSFADIFASNSVKNGLLNVTLPEQDVAGLIGRAREYDGYQLTVDLEQKRIYDAHGFGASFSVDDFTRHCLLEGLDDIALTLEHEAKITAYEKTHVLPWDDGPDSVGAQRG